MDTLNTTPNTNSIPFGLGRFSQILIACLAIQLVIVGIVFWPTRAASGAGGLVLDSFEMEDVSSLTITDDTGKQIVLQKGAAGWVLPEAGDYPVKIDKVTELLDSLVGLSTNRLVTRTAASHKRLQVANDDFARQIIVDTAGGESYILYLGSANVGSTHVRLAGQNETYLTGDLSVWQINPGASSWVDVDYFHVEREDITAITLQNANGEFHVEKDATGEWTMAGLAEDEQLETSIVTALTSRVSSIRLVEPIGVKKEAWLGLDPPQATVSLTTKAEGEGEQAYTIRVGAKNESDNYAVSASTSPYYVWVGSFAVQDFLERDREAFLAKPEAETSETGGSE